MSEEKPYWKQRRDLKNGAKPKPAEKRAAKKAVGVFYGSLIAAAPKCCENCGKPLAGSKTINPRTIVAHIIPKGKTNGCPSVALHPRNKWYACGDCHTDYDNKGAEFVQAMPIFKTLRERVLSFYHEIAANERRRVPQYFRP